MKRETEREAKESKIKEGGAEFKRAVKERGGGSLEKEERINGVQCTSQTGRDGGGGEVV